MTNKTNKTNKIELDLDFEELFPGEIFKIGKQEINIVPVNIEQIAGITKKLNIIMPIFKDKNITFKNFNKPENIIDVVTILIQNAPDILSEITGISEKSICKLPLEYAIKLFDIALKVNIAAKDSLEKNLLAVTETFKMMTPKAAK